MYRVGCFKVLCVFFGFFMYVIFKKFRVRFCFWLWLFSVGFDFIFGKVRV